MAAAVPLPTSAPAAVGVTAPSVEEAVAAMGSAAAPLVVTSPSVVAAAPLIVVTPVLNSAAAATIRGALADRVALMLTLPALVAT